LKKGQKIVGDVFGARGPEQRISSPFLRYRPDTAQMTMGISHSKVEPERREELHAKKSSEVPATANPSWSFLEKSSGCESQPLMTIMRSNAWVQLEDSKSQGLFSNSEKQDELQSKSKESSNGSPDNSHSREEFNWKVSRRSQSSLASHVRSSIGWALGCHSNASQISDSHQEPGPLPHTLVKTEASSEHLNPRIGSSTASRPIPTRRASHTHDEEDAEDLKRMFDRRTWDMYIRITESRKRANYYATNVSITPMEQNNFVPATEHNFETDRMEELDHSLESDQALIFGDLD
jgi:hypothetical protein